MGMSNTLRVMVFDDRQISGLAREEIAVIMFELDDQTAEDIAFAIGHLREMEGVMDVLQMPAYGKKGRLMTHLQLLCAPSVLEAVLAACFSQTGTLGIRYHIAQRAILPREEIAVSVDDVAMRVKVAQRPGGDFTAKLESDDLQNSRAATRAQRERIRHDAQRVALAKKATEK